MGPKYIDIFLCLSVDAGTNPEERRTYVGHVESKFLLFGFMETTTDMKSAVTLFDSGF